MKTSFVATQATKREILSLPMKYEKEVLGPTPCPGKKEPNMERRAGANDGKEGAGPGAGNYIDAGQTRNQSRLLKL